MSIVITEEFQRALDVLESGGNLFLTGKAGTGKSTLVRHFLATTERRVVVAAPTGIAALNVDGYTIHRLFGFRATTHLDDVRDGDYRPGRLTRTIKGLQTLVIDEASMVRADVLDMVEAALRRYGPRQGEPFGGVQVVLVGDLLQLPPVVEDGAAEHFETHHETPYFFSAHCFDDRVFPTVALSTVFRQLGDDRLTGLLNAVREGVLLEGARADLNSRVDPDFEPPDDELWLTLAPSNRIVTARNRQRLEALPRDVVEHEATTSGDVSGFDPPTDATLRFKPGAQVMLLSNDAGERWVNGTLGRIVDVAWEDGDPVVAVELADGAVVEVGPHVWEVTRPVAEGGALRREVVGTYRQLPFRLAWAITIHKSQGQTLDRLVVDLTGGVFATGQVYVALSRATSMDGLVLKRPVEPRHLRTDRRILRFLHRAAEATAPARHCAVGVSFVGDEGTFSRPRPVEIAVAFDDGTAVSTLVNPERDLADARAAYGIGADDVLLAPTLPEAWAVLAPLLVGWTPVGVGVDELLAKVDFELKRLGCVVSMPLPVDVPRRLVDAGEVGRLASPRAIERARAALAVFERVRADPSVELGSGSAFVDADGLPEPSCLLGRDSDLAVPATDRLPALAALVEVSATLGSLVLDDAVLDNFVLDDSGLDDAGNADGARRPGPVVTGAVVARIVASAERVTRLSPELVQRLRQVEEYVGERFVDDLLAGAASDAVTTEEALSPGARVCFTGEAVSPRGESMSRQQMEALAGEHGLVPVANVSKTRCDVLVVAEAGTQSGKARKAKQYGKPVITAGEFLAWAEAR